MRRPGLTIAIGTAALALALAGCDRGRGPGIATAGGAGATRSADPSAPAADKNERARQYAQCMREHGVPMQDPDEGGPKIDSGEEISKQQLSVADEACRAFAPADDAKQHVPDPAELEKLRQFAQCLRDHGVPDWPDPEPDGSFGQDPEVVNAKNSPHMRSAMEVCQDLLPGSNGKGVKGG
jgi:hypothetical protein